MTKIVFTVTTDLNNDQRMQRICNTLSKSGFDAKLIGRKQKQSSPLSKESYSQHRLNCFFQSGKLFYLEYNLRLLVKLLFTKADVFCAIDLDSIFPVLIAGKLKGAKLVYDAHEYFTELPTVVNRPFQKKIWTLVERFCVPKFDSHYTVSKSIADELTNKYGKEFNVIRNLPYQESSEKNEIQLDEKYILYQGAVKEGRSLFQLIDCMKEVDIKLKIAGDGPSLTNLKKYVDEHNLGSKIEFLGNLPVDELKKITRQCWIGVNPLENIGKSYYYSLSNKFFDYIQAGKPQISINFPEYKLINDEFSVAVMIDEFTSLEFKSAVQKLKDSEYYNRLSNNCHEAAKALNWKAEEKKLLEILARI